MPEAISTLSFAIRPRVVVKYLGLLSFMLAVLAAVPLMVSIVVGEYFLTQRYIVVIAFLVIIGLIGTRIEHSDELQNNEALTVTALAFILTPLLMAYPVMGSGLNFMDAWFEAVSAVTTTGLSTLESPADKPTTFLFARAWMQWYGGLGIVVLSVALLMGHHTAIKRLIGSGSESMMTTTRIYARRMLIIYSIISVIGFIILWWLLGDLFLALTHTLTAVSTGGFSSLNSSLGDISFWSGRYAIIFLSLLGALPLVLYYRIFRGSWRDVFGDSEFRVLLTVVFIISMLLSLSIRDDLNLSWDNAFGHGILLGISAQTTAGFTSINIDQLSSHSLALLIVAMFVGGGVGSTAGGVKILRLIIFFRMIQLLFQRSAMPSHAVIQSRIGDKVLEENEISGALLLIILYVLVIFISWSVFLLYDYPPLQALFEVCSATGTVGLSSGITSPDLQPLLKFTLCIDMLLGRLEIIALLIILYPPTWIGKHKE